MGVLRLVAFQVLAHSLIPSAIAQSWHLPPGYTAGTPFSYRYHPLNNGTNQARIQLNQSTFHLGFHGSPGNQAIPPELYEYRFFPDHRYQMYAMPASTRGENSSNYYHYFRRNNEQFNYLGIYPPLHYDDNSRTFYSVEADANDSIRSSYRLEDDDLKLIRTRLIEPEQREARGSSIPTQHSHTREHTRVPTPRPRRTPRTQQQQSPLTTMETPIQISTPATRVLSIPPMDEPPDDPSESIREEPAEPVKPEPLALIETRSSVPIQNLPLIIPPPTTRALSIPPTDEPPDDPSESIREEPAESEPPQPEPPQPEPPRPEPPRPESPRPEPPRPEPPRPEPPRPEPPQPEPPRPVPPTEPVDPPDASVTPSHWLQSQDLSAFDGSHGQSQLCSFAGYMSVVQNGLCLEPWELREEAQELLGPLFTRYQSCGPDEAVRCNPLLYGLAKEHSSMPLPQWSSDGDTAGQCFSTGANSGCCVQGAGGPNLPPALNASSSTQTCNQTLIGENEQVLRDIAQNPRLLAQYLFSANYYISQVCPTNPIAQVDGDCLALKQHLNNSLTFIYQGNEDWICSAALGYSRLGVITEIASNIRGTIEVLEEMNSNQTLVDTESLEGVFDWAKERRRIFQRVLSELEDHPTTQDIIEIATRNTSRCIVNGSNNCEVYCERKDGRPQVCHNLSDDGETKPEGRSVGYCWRYVKTAILGNYIKDYPNSEYAKNAVEDLKREGFINIMENDYFTNITVDNAPPGSIIVYENITDPTEPGHVEIVANEPCRYVSDFCSATPVSTGSARRPIGIMIPDFHYDPETGEVEFKLPNA